MSMAPQGSMVGSAEDVFESIRGSKDVLSVQRAYGEAYDVDGVTVIPVARVSGGAAGGGGEGSDEEQSGGGFGTGFGLNVNPIGVYEVRGTTIEWKPAIDANRLLRGGQILGGIIAVCITIVALARSRSR
jgi:uncharacterized spore protein YtfJ